jgi:hypothetical protein
LHIGDKRIDAVIVKAEPVDKRIGLRQPKQTRLGIAGLGARRYGADFNEAEAERSQTVDISAILVQPCSETDRVGKSQSHYRTRIGPGAGNRFGNAERRSAFECGQCQIVRSFGIEGKQERAGEGV